MSQTVQWNSQCCRRAAMAPQGVSKEINGVHRSFWSFWTSTGGAKLLFPAPGISHCSQQHRWGVNMLRILRRVAKIRCPSGHSDTCCFLVKSHPYAFVMCEKQALDSDHKLLKYLLGAGVKSCTSTWKRGVPRRTPISRVTRSEKTAKTVVHFPV